MLNTGILATSATVPSSFSRLISTSFSFMTKYFEITRNKSTLKASRVSGETPVRSWIKINWSLLLPVFLLPFPLRSHRLIFSNTFWLLSVKSKEFLETGYQPFGFIRPPYRHVLPLDPPRDPPESSSRFRIIYVRKHYWSTYVG